MESDVENPGLPKSLELLMESNLENVGLPKSLLLLMESNLENVFWPKSLELFKESNLESLSGKGDNPLSCMLKESNFEKLSKSPASLYLGELPNLDKGVAGTESSKVKGLFL